MLIGLQQSFMVGIDPELWRFARKLLAQTLNSATRKKEAHVSSAKIMNKKARRKGPELLL